MSEVEHKGQGLSWLVTGGTGVNGLIHWFLKHINFFVEFYVVITDSALGLKGYREFKHDVYSQHTANSKNETFAICLQLSVQWNQNICICYEQ